MKQHRTKDGYILSATFLVYLVNRFCLKESIDIPILRYILRCHFNDFLAGILFLAYINLLLSFSKFSQIRIQSISAVTFIMCLCGIAWEYVLPLLHGRGTCDPWDIGAYICGGIAYTLIVKQNFPKQKA